MGTYADNIMDVVVFINKDITLSGGWHANYTIQSGTSLIDAQGARGGFEVITGVTASIENFAVRNGSRLQGGGILNSGTLTIDRATVSNNTANSGGGVYNSGTLIINKSVVSNNTAWPGGGGGITNSGVFIFYTSTINNNDGSFGWGVINSGYSGFGTFELNNSTISDNTSDSRGGGIYNIGNGTITINNGTITGNNSTYSSGGGGINNETGSVTLQNSIIAGNTNDNNDGPDCKGTVSSSGYNLIGDTSGCTFFSTTGDLLIVYLFLGPLQDNGGPTFTHALLPGSPAIDAGNPVGCTDQDGNLLTTDQPGITRPQGAACDIGAFELELANTVVEVSIDIKPGSGTNPINTKSKGVIPVAILSTADFDAPSMVDVTSLTFGKTGDETSLASCNNDAENVNEDGLPDLVCHFYTQSTDFQKGDTEGILKGQTMDGNPIEGSDNVKILK